MPKPSAEAIADIVLDRRRVYGLETDSRIREVANHVTARTLLEVLSRTDDQSPHFEEQLAELLSGLPRTEHTLLIGFDTGDIPAERPESNSTPAEEPKMFYLKLIFCDEQASYYQFPLFPDLNADYVLGCARKRTGAAQHLQITLSRGASRQTFIEACRRNPHFLRIEESTAEEFDAAPSNGV